MKLIRQVQAILLMIRWNQGKQGAEKPAGTSDHRLNMLQDSVDQQAPSTFVSWRFCLRRQVSGRTFSHMLLSLLCLTFCLLFTGIASSFLSLRRSTYAPFVQLTVGSTDALCASCCVFSSSCPLGHSSLAILSVERLCPWHQKYRVFDNLRI